ncbi:MAG TPA: hybrid sensor histidine kinase/response regulator [Polyangiaceae bacterium]|nr:hybrid sensor histidine kinase/response regulator [Polyangiaceae bacterium]
MNSEVSAERSRAIRTECVRMMYRQTSNSIAASLGVTLFIVATLWRNVPHRLIGYFLVLQAIAQVLRAWVILRYRRVDLVAGNSELWARRYTAYMFVAGLVWASAGLLFFRADSPISQVCTMCGLCGIAGGAVAGHAHHPPALQAFVVPIFVIVFVRLATLGSTEYVALGVASLFYMAILLAFCRVQHRSLVESIQIRFENADLIAELQIQKASAERAKARAEQADLAKSRFLAAASHDLRQPLHALSLFSATLRELELDEKQRAVVEQIYRNIDSLEALFDELLDISKLDAGYIRPSLMHFPVQRVLDVLGTRYAALAHGKSLSFRVRPSSEVVRADAALLERVLGNLVANAIRYTHEGGVLVGCQRRAGDLLISVWDTGIGIPEAQHERIFEEFFQLGNPERDRKNGLGLGLPIARRMARLLGTELELDSELGRGSRFGLRVPLGDRASVVRGTPELVVSGDALAGRCVVVIDDEAAIRQGMHELLSQWGCTSVEANSAGEAITRLERAELTPELVLADYRLLDNTVGSEAVLKLRARFGAELPALLITGDTAPERLREAKQSGLHILHKPVRPAQLRALCNYLLTRQPSST